MNKITINDIAKMANVSKSTVSRYLNNGRVSEDTANKIKKIIEEFNYEPNIFAQSLKAKSTKLIGIIAPRLDSIVTSRAIMSIDENLKKKGYNSLILNTSLDTNLELEYLEMLLNIKVDGIILLATQISEKHKTLIKRIPIPIIVIGQKCSDTVCIVNDDYGAGYKMGQHIKSKGHKKILYVGVDKQDRAIGVRRRNGVFDQFDKDCNYEIKEIISDFTTDTSERLVLEALGEYSPTAIICATDKIAVGAIRAIEKIDKIPFKDISVTGFGGYSTMKRILTTIRYNSVKVGKVSVDTMIMMIEGSKVDKLQVIDFDFIDGDSVEDINN